MKRRVISIITVLALCLSLCPTWTLAAALEPDPTLCPHHRVHTVDCGFVPPSQGQDCTHVHDENCFITDSLCIHQHTEDCFPQLEPDSLPDGREPSLCTHECTQESGCVTLTPDCPHIHDVSCGYVQDDPGAPCTFVCQVCPIEDLIDKLPRTVTQDNQTQVEDLLNEILALYTDLSDGDQELLDMSLCLDLLAQLDNANTPVLLNDSIPDDVLTRNEEHPYATVIFEDETWFYDTKQFSLTTTKEDAFQVESGGILRIIGSGTIISKAGAGANVSTGGELYIEDSHIEDFRLTISGSTYGLDIASGATVKLSGGMYTGNKAAIRTADGNFDALLAPGHGFFDTSGNLITDADALARARTVVVDVVQSDPVITWDDGSPVNVPYDGSPVEKTDLSGISSNLTIPNLSEKLKYFYKRVDTDGSDLGDFTEGLPTNAGTYHIKAVLPESKDYKEAETDHLILIVEKIPALITAPAGKTLTYNGTAQELVTAGILDEGSIREGAVVEYALDEDGPYSTEVPTGLRADRNYQVWYRVEDTPNFTGVPATEVENVEIQRKNIRPIIELEYTSILYDGGIKEPKVTVKDPDDQTVLPVTEYEVKYASNQNVGSAVVTVTDLLNGNYDITGASVNFEITNQTQDALSITNKPNTVTYGDKFTLTTANGSGNGDVTWEITAGNSVAEVDEHSGQVTITGVGTATVKATKSSINYEEATATWQFTSVKKPVTAVVTVASKPYDGPDEATVTKAEVASGDLVSGVSVTIGLDKFTATFDNANAGTNKTVTVDSSDVDVDTDVYGTNTDKYIISFPATVTANITKATPSNPDLTAKDRTYDGTAEDLVEEGMAYIDDTDIDDIPLKYALSENGPYLTAIPKATNAGDYEVWYRVEETNNYFGTAAQPVSVTIDKKTV